MIKLKTNQNNKAERRAVEQIVKKMRSDSKWKGLTVEQWLFKDNLGYEATAERVKTEFGLETSAWSVMRFYRHRARMRQSLELLEAQVTSDQISAIPANTENMRATALKLLAKNAIVLGTQKPEDVEGLISLSKVLLDGELNEIRLRRVKLEERYYDFEANAACAKDLEKVRAYIKAVGDNENLSAEEKHERVMELLFGKEKANAAEAEQAESQEEAGGDFGKLDQSERDYLASEENGGGKDENNA